MLATIKCWAELAGRRLTQLVSPLYSAKYSHLTVKLSCKQMGGRAGRKGIGVAGESILFTRKVFQSSVLTRRHRAVKAAAAKAAAMAAMEVVAEAATAETTAAATEAMTQQANVAEATEGEVAAADGSAATPAEAVTAITSHPTSSPYTLSAHQFFSCFFIALCVQKEK
jgi:hypothetical protein